MEYIRKPSKISKEKKTTFSDGILTGENGSKISVKDIVSLHYNRRFDGTTKLIVADPNTKVTITSHCVENSRLVQRRDIVDGFLSAIKSETSHQIDFVTGSNSWFWIGVGCIALGMAVSSIIAIALFNGDEIPRKAFSGVALLILGIAVTLRGKAKIKTLNDPAQQANAADA